MRAKFPLWSEQEFLITAEPKQASGYSYFLPSVFKYTQPKDIWMCVNPEIQPLVVKFFGIPNNLECYETRYMDHVLEIWGVADSHDRERRQLIGTAHFEKDGPAKYDAAISVWLPDKQKVYPPNPHRYGRTLYGSMIQHFLLKGVYRNASGSIERPISIFLSPNANLNHIGGYMKGQQFIDIQSNF